MTKEDLASSRLPLGLVLWIATAIGFTILLVVAHSPVAPLPGIVTMLLLPGSVVMSLLGVRPEKNSSRTVLAVCLSLMVIMVVGGAASFIGPHFGDTRPLDSSTQYYLWSALLAVILISCSFKRRDPVRWIFNGVEVRHLTVLLISSFLVVLSILGAARLNHSGDNSVAVISAGLDVAVLLVGIIGGWRRTSRWPLASILYSVTLAVILATSLRGGHLYGFDIQQEFGVASRTISTGIWVIPPNHDPYASMLSLTVLPAILHSMVRLRLTAFFELVVPSVLALLPVAMFSAVSSVPRWIRQERPTPRPGLAFGVVASFVVASQVFPVELPAISRQALALVILTGMIMVLFDSSIPTREARIAISLLLITISFTHYSTSYLLAGSLLVAWLVELVWVTGWIFVPSYRVQEHRLKERHRKVIGVTLVLVAFVAAFGWNLGITRNNALSAPAHALVASGLELSNSPGSSPVSASALEGVLVRELRENDKWLQPVPGSRSIKLVTATAPSSPGVAPRLVNWWNQFINVLHDGLWALAGVAILYGIFFLERRRDNGYASDLVGIAVAGLVVGAASRFIGTIQNFYSTDRAAIVAAIFLVVPVTIFLDDLASRISKGLLFVGTFVTFALLTWATGLGVLFFGGQAPSALVGIGENDERFLVSTSELGTAIWLKKNLNSNDLVQSDYFGQLVLSSEPHTYGLLPEIIPPGVDHRAFIFLTTTNLIQQRSRVTTLGGNLTSVYKSNLGFFNRHFFVVYSSGTTRVYH